ncbi:50S ribosomal protein L13 [Chloroflexota bacterium]|nr:50S ribosomal protein L13 [Chloroflexota bacterium]
MYKTYATKLSEVEPVWFVVDASGLTLGRLSTRIAVVLRGKHKPMFSPSLDTGDFVVVINAEKVVVTGDRLDQKKYYRHSLYLGGLKRLPCGACLKPILSVQLRWPCGACCPKRRWAAR